MKLKDVYSKDVTYSIYVDLDGVLADFEAGVNYLFTSLGRSKFELSKYNSDRKYKSAMWEAIISFQKERGDIFWRNLPITHDAHTLLSYIEPYGFEVLTATGKPVYNAADQKHRWCRKHLGKNVIVNTVQRSADKARFAKKDAILIDDQKKSIEPWIKAGGIGILHTSAHSTIAHLKELGL